MPVDTPAARAALLAAFDGSITDTPVRDHIMVTVELHAALRRIDALEAENARLREALRALVVDADDGTSVRRETLCQDAREALWVRP